jgi:ABC-type transport system involved in multi-copper enzyme maturation permease subunit
MAVTADISEFEPQGESSWAVRHARSIGEVFLLSLRRLIHSKFMLAALIFALVPVLVSMLKLLPHQQNQTSLAEAQALYQTFLRLFYLHFAVFFVGNFLGFSVMRQEHDDRTLHFLILQPVPRWTLVVGKLAASLLLSSVICIVSLMVTYLILTVSAVGPAEVFQDLFQKSRLAILAREAITVVTGLLAYTSVAMLMGSLFKSSQYLIFLFGWEAGLPYLPSALKYWTVLHYLNSLLPTKITGDAKWLEILSKPVPEWICFIAIGGATVLVLSFCVFLFQTRECLYGDA